MNLHIRTAEGRPAAGALVSIAEAPVSVKDLGLVADDAGVVQLHAPASGRWMFSIWFAGKQDLVSIALAPELGRQTITLSP